MQDFLLILQVNKNNIDLIEPSLDQLDKLQFKMKAIETQLMLIDDSVQALDKRGVKLNSLDFFTGISARESFKVSARAHKHLKKKGKNIFGLIVKGLTSENSNKRKIARNKERKLHEGERW